MVGKLRVSMKFLPIIYCCVIKILPKLRSLKYQLFYCILCGSTQIGLKRPITLLHAAPTRAAWYSQASGLAYRLQSVPWWEWLQGWAGLGHQHFQTGRGPIDFSCSVPRWQETGGGNCIKVQNCHHVTDAIVYWSKNSQASPDSRSGRQTSLAITFGGRLVCRPKRGRDCWWPSWRQASMMVAKMVMMVMLFEGSIWSDKLFKGKAR